MQAPRELPPSPPPAAEPAPSGPSLHVRLAGGGDADGAAENGVLVLLSSNPRLDEHSFVCTHTPMVTMGPGISAWGWGCFRTRVAAFWPQLTLEWVLDAQTFPSSVPGGRSGGGACRRRAKVGLHPKVQSNVVKPSFFQI